MREYRNKEEAAPEEGKAPMHSPATAVEPNGDRKEASPERRCSSRTFRYGYLVTT